MAGIEKRSHRNRSRSSSASIRDESHRYVKDEHKIKKKRSLNYVFHKFCNPRRVISLVIGVVFLSLIFILILKFMKSMDELKLPRVVTPFPSPKIMDLVQFQGEHKESMYWGTYRPNLYLGIRARAPQSLLAGLMWISIKDGMYHIRHVCQDADDLRKYGWVRHNGRDYGHQEFIDMDMIFSTSFFKSKESGSGYGGDWAVRVNMESLNLSEEFWTTTHFFFYLADEGGNALNIGMDSSSTINERFFLASGSRLDIGNWQFHLASSDSLSIHYCGFKTQNFHNLSDLVQLNLGVQLRMTGKLQLSDSLESFSNVLFFQISGSNPFIADFSFLSGTGLASSNTENRLKILTGSSLTSKLSSKQEDFDQKFRDCFTTNDTELDNKWINAGKAAIGNMIGSMGYFYGQSQIVLPEINIPKDGDNLISYWPVELFTAVPSRPFFPRGFIWDEGFHQLLIWRWDLRICLDILGHWLDIMNIDGWIPREQILGAEALSKVPGEFVHQHPTNGNPPTMFLVLHDIISGVKKNMFSTTQKNEIYAFLDGALSRLEAWFKWFNTTQSGYEVSSYFWHGRDNKTTRELNPKTLMSGLDDIPRASHPSGEERHVDLRCWMFIVSDCIRSVIEILHKENTKPEYVATTKILSDFELLNEMHFDVEHGTYLDYGNHTEKVRLRWRIDNHRRRELVREVLEKPKLRFVPHISYNSLFPFMLKLIPPGSWILEKQMELIANPNIFWTKYGLRSLSKTSSMYLKYNTEHDRPYWRGPIWVNMNYMVLSALHHYSTEEGPYKDRALSLYKELRSSLITNVVEKYNKSGFLWEQYDMNTGEGKGARLFTGWTSLFLLPF